MNKCCQCECKLWSQYVSFNKKLYCLDCWSKTERFTPLDTILYEIKFIKRPELEEL